MPRYYIHVIEGDTVHCDPEGSKAADLAAAEKLARSAARELAAEALRAGKGDWAALLRVEDEQKRRLFDIDVACTLFTSWTV